MKKLLFILLITLIAFAACNNKKNHSVVGKWKPIEMDIKNMEADEKKEMIDSLVLEFTADGKFSNKVSREIFHGTYTYNEKDSTLTATSTFDNKPHEFKISWDGDYMIMRDEDGVVKLKQ